MADEKQIRKIYREETARVAARAKMSDSERTAIRADIHRAIDQRDFPKFKAAILKLGLVESSKQFEAIEKLWNELASASRSPSKPREKP